MEDQTHSTPEPSAGSETPDDPASEHGDEHPPGPERPVEIGGPKGPEPTRYGDWERKGRCSDF